MKACPYISSTSLLGGRRVRLGLGEAGASRGPGERTERTGWPVAGGPGGRSAGGGAGVVGGSWTVAGGAVGVAGQYVSRVGGWGQARVSGRGMGGVAGIGAVGLGVGGVRSASSR